MAAEDIVTMLREMADDIETEVPKFLAVVDAAKEVLAQLDYLQGLWGKEGITDGLASRLRGAIEGLEG